MKKQNQEKLQLWQGRILEQESSGLSIRSWCEENHVKQSQFFYWKKRLLFDPETEISFAEISLEKKAMEPIGDIDRFEAPVRIRYKGYEVLVGTMASCTQLAAVLEALQQTC